MTRRIEAGPVLVGLGALLLLVSVFLDWYDPNVTAWEAFEVLDLLMVVLSLAAIVAVVGTFAPSAAVIDRRSLPLIVAALAVIVASQILDPPPGVSGDPTTGAWQLAPPAPGRRAHVPLGRKRPGWRSSVAPNTGSAPVCSCRSTDG